MFSYYNFSYVFSDYSKDLKFWKITMVDLGMAGGGGSGGLGGSSPAAQQYCLKWNNHQVHTYNIDK